MREAGPHLAAKVIVVEGDLLSLGGCTAAASCTAAGCTNAVGCTATRGNAVKVEEGPQGPTPPVMRYATVCGTAKPGIDVHQLLGTFPGGNGLRHVHHRSSLMTGVKPCVN